MTIWLNEDEGSREEHRREVRRRLTLDSVIYLPESHERLFCTVINLSQHGGGIRCKEAERVSDEFVLFIRGSEAMRRDCVVVRRARNELGVLFRHR